MSLRNSSLAVWFLAVGLSCPSFAFAEEPLPTAEELVERLIERSGQAQQKFKEHQFSYSKRSVIETLDSNGTAKDRDEKLYKVFCKEGRCRMTLMELNGQATKAGQRARGELNDLKPAKGEERPLVLTKEMLGRYDFEVVEKTTVAGRDSYLLTFKPKPNWKEEDTMDRVLNRMQGKIWIDQQIYELVRAEIGLQAPVTFFGGIIGAVNHFSYTVERAPISSGIWINRVSHGEFEFRKLLVSRHYRTDSEWKEAE